MLDFFVGLIFIDVRNSEIFNFDLPSQVEHTIVYVIERLGT
jgi:hypothetical protein